MKALLYDGSQLALVEDYPAPQPGADEVVVEVRLAGICRTDIEITRGYMDFRGVLGHEFVGLVTAAGGAEGQKWKGRRVVSEINCVCGKCEMCQAGLKTHCQCRTVLGIDGRDGCMAERIAVPVGNLFAVPDSVVDEQAIFVEPLAAAFQVVQQVRPIPKDSAVVIGDGRLGQLVAQVLISRGIRPLVVGMSRDKLRRLDRMGISCLLASEARPRRQAQLVVEASGSSEGFEMAMEFVRPRGTIVLKSTLADGAQLNLCPIVIHEITVLGSRCGPFGDALAALASGTVDTEGLITAEFPLSEGCRAMEAAQHSDALKVVVRP